MIVVKTPHHLFNNYPLSPQISASDKSQATRISLEPPLAPTTPTYSPIPRQVTVTTTNITTPNSHSPPRIITKRARLGRLIAESLISHSTTKLSIVLDESASSNSGVPFSDTSWAEVFHDISLVELLLNTTRIEAFRGA
jgi:hypothetical protein